MSVEDSEVIDFIGQDKGTGEVVLTISDHLDWSDVRQHIRILQEKLNCYIRFIESGQIYAKYPTSKHKTLTIEIMGKYPLPEEGKAFVLYAESTVNSIGVSLEFKCPD